MVRVLIFTMLYLLSVGICEGLDIFNFHDYCGSTISENAGELRFDAQKIPSYLSGSKCSVTISPQSVMFNTKTQVLFYFTKFDISIFCEDTNVTVFDGTPYSRSGIKGLPSYICGHNRTLEKPDQTFTTDSNQLTVTFRRSDYGRRFSGNFSIKYVEFTTGECDGQGIYKCKNGRCIPNAYRCSNEINACGDTQDNCADEEEAAKTFLDTVVNIARNLMWIAAIVIGAYILRYLWQKYNQRIMSAFRRLTGGSPQEDRHSVQFEATPTQDVISPDRDAQPEQTLLSSAVSETADSRSSSISSNIDFTNAPSNGVGITSSDTQQTNSTPSCPPPSYEDVMAIK